MNSKPKVSAVGSSVNSDRDHDAGPMHSGSLVSHAVGPDFQEPKVSAAGLTRRQGYWFQQAFSGPVYISHHHRVSHVLTTAEWFYRNLTGGKNEDDEARSIVRNTAELFGEGFVWFDKDLRFVEANSATCSYLSRERDQLIGRPLEDVFPGIVDKPIYHKICLSLRDGTMQSADLPTFVRSGGWAHVQAFPFRGGVACIFRIITESVEAQRLADVKSAMVRAIETHGEIGYARMNNRMIVERIDHGLANFLGIDPDAGAGKRFSQLFAADQQESVAEWLDGALTNSGGHTKEFKLGCDDGSSLPVRMAVAEINHRYVGDGAVAVITPLGEADT